MHSIIQCIRPSDWNYTTRICPCHPPAIPLPSNQICTMDVPQTASDYIRRPLSVVHNVWMAVDGCGWARHKSIPQPTAKLYTTDGHLRHTIRMRFFYCSQHPSYTVLYTVHKYNTKDATAEQIHRSNMPRSVITVRNSAIVSTCFLLVSILLLTCAMFNTTTFVVWYQEVHNQLVDLDDKARRFEEYVTLLDSSHNVQLQSQWPLFNTTYAVSRHPADTTAHIIREIENLDVTTYANYITYALQATTIGCVVLVVLLWMYILPACPRRVHSMPGRVCAYSTMFLLSGMLTAMVLMFVLYSPGQLIMDYADITPSAVEYVEYFTECPTVPTAAGLTLYHTTSDFNLLLAKVDKFGKAVVLFGVLLETGNLVPHSHDVCESCIAFAHRLAVSLGSYPVSTSVLSTAAIRNGNFTSGIIGLLDCNVYSHMYLVRIRTYVILAGLSMLAALVCITCCVLGTSPVT